MKMKRWLLLLFLCAGIPRLLSSINIEVVSGIVETTSGMFVEIDGDLSGDGYFSGKITSGARTGMTTFAGLTLSSGMNGMITRTTGSAYAKSNGEGTNLKRYYELSNTGGSVVTANMSAAYVSSGSYDEQNGLSGPYFIYRYASSAWTGYGDGSSASPASASSVQIPTGSSDWVLSEGVRVAVKIFLEGPYNAASDAMTTTLDPDGSDYIPDTSPYTEDNRTTTIPSGQSITDWVLVELRTTEDGAAVGYRSCLLKSSGMLVADNGTTEYIGVPVAPGSYWVVIRHRNHLAVETKTVRSDLTWGTTPGTYNFTSANTQFKGDDAALLEAGVYGMYAGDTNGSGIITNSDKDPIITNLNSAGYYDADANCSAIVTNADKDPIITNLNKASNI